MPSNSLTNISTDRNLIQQLFWDQVSGRIQVMHEINLYGQKSARLSSKDYSIEKDKVAYSNKLIEYELSSKTKSPITEYTYTEYEDNARDYPILATYPGIGQYYVLSGLPHIVVAKFVRSDGVSKTSGEALSA